jgi:hypothetical protein
VPDIEKIRKLNDAIVREAQKFPVTEALAAMGCAAAAAICTCPKENRDKILQAFVGTILNSMKQIDAGGDPFRVLPN